jgi:hypothetical protein
MTACVHAGRERMAQLHDDAPGVPLLACDDNTWEEK